MNIKQIFQNARVLVSDKKHNSNLSSEDTFIKDVQLWQFLNDAITEFDFNTGIERFAYEDGNFTINILPDLDLYNLPPDIAKIDTVELVNGANTILLKEVAYENLLQNTTCAIYQRAIFLEPILKVKQNWENLPKVTWIKESWFLIR